MGRGKGWSLEERETLAIAWSAVSCDPVVGRNQTSERFILRLKVKFDRRSPPEHEEGTFKHRSAQALSSFWKNTVMHDINQFCKTLRSVYCSNLTGCTDADKVNIAVTMHFRGKKSVHYSYREENPKQWPNYLAWKAVKDLPKFKYEHHERNDIVGPAASAAVVTNPATTTETELPPVRPPVTSIHAQDSAVSVTEPLTDERSNQHAAEPISIATPASRPPGRNKAKRDLKRSLEGEANSNLNGVAFTGVQLIG